MSKIPERARGYRSGYRNVVAAMHRYADRLNYHGAKASLHAYAHWVGVLGKERFDFLVFNKLVPGAVEPKNVPVGPAEYRRNYQRRKRTDEEVSKMLVSAELLSSVSNKSSPYCFGYIEGIGDGLSWVIIRELELHDIKARQAITHFTGTLNVHLEKLMIGKSIERFSGVKTDKTTQWENDVE